MKNKIETGTVQDLITRVNESLGHKIEQKDVAVVKDVPEFSGKFDVSKQNIVEFLKQVEPMLNSNNIAVVTAEDMLTSKNKKTNSIKLK